MLKSYTPLNSIKWLILERIAALMLGLMATLAVARHLSPEAFGSLSYLLALASLAAPLMALGLNSIVTRELVTRPNDASLIVGSSISLRLAAGSCVGQVIIALAYVFLTADEAHLLAFLLISSIFNAALVIEFWLQAQTANHYASMVRLASMLVFTIARLLAVFNDADMAIFVYLSGLEGVCVAFLYMFVYQKIGNGVNQLRASWSEAKDLIRDSRWLLLSGIAAVIYLKVDQVMLGILVNDRAVGIYAAAARVSEVWYFFSAAIVTSFFPKLLVGRKNDSKRYALNLQKLNDLLLWVAVSVAFIVSLCASWLMPLLFGEIYKQSIPVLKIHVWVGLFVFMRALLSKWFIAENLLKLSMMSQVLGALVNVALNIWLIPVYGPVGAAYATVVSYAVAGYLVLFLHRDLWPMSLVVSRSILLPYRLLRKGRNLYQP